MATISSSSPANVCIAGAGPAGVILALLLARKGISVTLLEAQADFDRDFRGDTLHASALEILDQMGLGQPVLALCHARVPRFQIITTQDTVTMADFSRLDTPYPFIGLVPQARLLEFLTNEARKYPNFTLIMNAKAHELIIENDRVCGVRYHKDGQAHDVRALLTIGADGRGSRVRELAGIKLGKTTPPMDVLWFKLPRPASFGAENATSGRFGSGTALAILDRGSELQCGFIILKGSYKSLREKGLPALQEDITTLMPALKESAAALKDWSQCAILSVVTGRVERWHRPGLLLIGDAAHVMSPVGGVGINYAIHDAVAAANVLSGPLLKGKISDDDLHAVQLRRERAIRFIQSVQSLIQRRIIAGALESDAPFRPPLLVRLLARFGFFQKRLARIMAYGLDPERVEI